MHIQYCLNMCHDRFNRYMVECESIRTGSENDVNDVLIDTWWNVNQVLPCSPNS